MKNEDHQNDNKQHHNASPNSHLQLYLTPINATIDRAGLNTDCTILSKLSRIPHKKYNMSRVHSDTGLL